MRLQQLRLVNFVGFDDETIDFEPDLTVLVGRNGSGKSATLTGLSCVITQSIVKAVPTVRQWPFWYSTEDDVRRGADVATIEATFQDDVRASMQFGRGLRSNDELQLRDAGLTRFLATAIDTASAPLFVAMKANRHFPFGAERVEAAGTAGAAESTDLLAIWRSAALLGVDTYAGFVDWFRREENAENEVRLGGDDRFRKPSLEAVRGALSMFLSVLGNGDYANPRFSRVGPDGDPLKPATDGSFVLDKSGRPMLLDQMSDGEQIMLLTVADIGRRLAISNPSASAPLDGHGIVLIDEVELHLHPGWQRTLLPALRSTFPNLQLVVTTHSPQVLGSVENRSVRVLEEFRVSRLAKNTRGRDSNALLRDVLGADDRAADTLSALDEVARLVDAEEFEAAGAALDELAALLTEGDPQVVHYRTLLGFLQ